VAPHGHEEIPTLKSVFEIPHLRENAKFLDTQCLLLHIYPFSKPYIFVFQIECLILLGISYLKGCTIIPWAPSMPMGQMSVAALWMSPQHGKRKERMERVGLLVNIFLFFNFD